MSSNVVLRIPKGVKLTYEEADNNFKHIQRLFRFTEDAPAVFGTGDAIELTSSTLAVESLVDGLWLGFTATADSTITNPTINVDGLGAIVVENNDGTALEAGAFVTGSFYVVRYNQSSNTFRVAFGAAAPAGETYSFSSNFIESGTDPVNVSLNPAETITLDPNVPVDFGGVPVSGIAGGIEQQGNSTATPGGNGWSVSLMDSTGSAFAMGDVNQGEISYWTWNGTNYVQQGSILAETGPRVAFIDTDKIASYSTAGIKTFDWNGASWVQEGNTNVAGSFAKNMTRLDTNKFVVYRGDNQLRTYVWDGTNWAQEGNSLTTAGVTATSIGIAALSPTLVALVGFGNSNIQMFSWDGTDFTLVDSWPVPGGTGGDHALAAIDSTTLAYFRANDDTLRILKWDGSSLTATGDSLSIPNLGVIYADGNRNGTFVLTDGGNTDIIRYSFSSGKLDLPSSLSIGGVTYAFPGSQGTGSLTNDGTGVLSWDDSGGGGTSDEAFKDFIFDAAIDDWDVFAAEVNAYPGNVNIWFDTNDAPFGEYYFADGAANITGNRAVVVSPLGPQDCYLYWDATGGGFWCPWVTIKNGPRASSFNMELYSRTEPLVKWDSTMDSYFSKSLTFDEVYVYFENDGALLQLDNQSNTLGSITFRGGYTFVGSQFESPIEVLGTATNSTLNIYVEDFGIIDSADGDGIPFVKKNGVTSITNFILDRTAIWYMGGYDNTVDGSVPVDATTNILYKQQNESSSSVPYETKIAWVSKKAVMRNEDNDAWAELQEYTTWDSSTNYFVGDHVKGPTDNDGYLCVTNSFNDNPETDDGTFWRKVDLNPADPINLNQGVKLNLGTTGGALSDPSGTAVRVEHNTGVELARNSEIIASVGTDGLGGSNFKVFVDNTVTTNLQMDFNSFANGPNVASGITVFPNSDFDSENDSEAGSFRWNSGSSLMRLVANSSVATGGLRVESDALGFFGVTPVAKPTVTGSAGGNAALQSLLTALENLGLITDSST